MHLQKIKNNNCSTIFLIYECAHQDVNVFQNQSQKKVLEAFEPLQLPENEAFVLPAFPFPANDFQLIFKSALDKTEYNSDFKKFERKLQSNLLLESLKSTTTKIVSPIIFQNGKLESDSYLYRIGEENLSRFISPGEIKVIGDVMGLSNVKGLRLVEDIEQKSHLRLV